MAAKSFLTFRQVRDTGKTKVFSVDGKFSGESLGFVKWYGSWRRYVFYPGQMMLFDSGCLTEITTFIDGLMAERKTKA